MIHRVLVPFSPLLLVAALLLPFGHATYVTRPDITPTSWNVTYTAQNASLASGYIFLAPRTVQPGNLAIYTQSGQLVWYSTPFEVANGGGGGGAYDLRVQTYQGQTGLTYWAGTQAGGNGYGFITMLGQNYSTLWNVSAPTPLSDMHETRLTRNNTLLTTVYNTTDGVDASMVDGGLTDTYVLDACFYELALPSGTPLFQWCASKNGITADESFLGIGDTPSESEPWDWMHPNSLDKDELGNYLFSLRHGHMIIYVNATDSSIIWRLGGMKSDFSGQGANFSWQHDAQWVLQQGDNDAQTLRETMASGRRQLTIFNNAANATVQNETESRGMLVELDFANKTATLITQYSHPNNETLLATSQGNTQYMHNAVMDDNEVQPNSSNVLMGYGYVPVFAEYAVDGTPLQVTHFGQEGETQSYRVYKQPWTAMPTSKPVVAVDANGTAYASWNGATEVSIWHFFRGRNTSASANTSKANDSSSESFDGFYARKGSFETAIDFNLTSGEVVFVRALDKNGKELGRSSMLQYNGTQNTTWSANYDGYTYQSASANASSTSSNASAVTASIYSTGTSTSTPTVSLSSNADAVSRRVLAQSSCIFSLLIVLASWTAFS